MTGLKRLAKSFVYAYRGFAKTLKEEQNLKIHLAAAVVVAAAAFYLGLSRLDFAILAIVIGLVLLMEIANSAVERITDILKPRLHVYVKEIKDIAAAAVLVSALLAALVGALVFYPYLFG